MTDASASDPRRPAPIPLTILTGFLGAGKTTLLNRLLREPGLADTLVIINEFGDVALDHLLVETIDDDMILLSAGCVCCTVRGDLVAGLEDLLRRRDNGRITPFRRVILETTGLADPSPVIGAILHHPYLSLRYSIASVLCAVDVTAGAAILGRHPEARRQAAMADRIVLTKTDMAVGSEDAAPLLALLNSLAPEAPRLDAERDDIAVAITSGGSFELVGKIASVADWLKGDAGEAAHARIRSLVLRADAPLRASALDMFLDLLRSSFGPRILRIKGLVDLAEQPGRPLVVQGTAHVVHVPGTLPEWPDDDRRTRLVVIVEDIPPAPIERLWHAFTGQPAPDTPDATALSDNPLAPATLGASLSPRVGRRPG